MCLYHFPISGFSLRYTLVYIYCGRSSNSRILNTFRTKLEKSLDCQGNSPKEEIDSVT